jgi:hypothetical protein
MTDELKRGDEILSEYFESLKDNPAISEDIRQTTYALWKENKLKTKTHLSHALEELRAKKNQ